MFLITWLVLLLAKVVSLRVRTHLLDKQFTYFLFEVHVVSCEEIMFLTSLLYFTDPLTKEFKKKKKKKSILFLSDVRNVFLMLCSFS